GAGLRLGDRLENSEFPQRAATSCDVGDESWLVAAARIESGLQCSALCCPDPRIVHRVRCGEGAEPSAIDTRQSRDGAIDRVQKPPVRWVVRAGGIAVA